MEYSGVIGPASRAGANQFCRRIVESDNSVRRRFTGKPGQEVVKVDPGGGRSPRRVIVERIPSRRRSG